MSASAQVGISIGIFAHNEEDLIEQVVMAYVRQRTERVRVEEIVVVSCASTDRTDALVEGLALSSPLVRLLARRERRGKVDAIAAFARRATGEILVISSADVEPADTTVERIVAPLVDNESCGMVGPRVCPSPGAAGVTARLHRLLWLLHHEMAVVVPKLGETVAIRASHLRRELPTGVFCDEVLLESRVREDGAGLRYEPSAQVINFAPATLAQFFGQRRRIACQHRAARRYLGYRPASSRAKPLVVASVRALRLGPHLLPALVGLAAVEGLARLVGRLDHVAGRRYRVWPQTGRPNRPPGLAAVTELTEQL